MATDPSNPPTLDPLVARAEPRTWRHWATALAHSSRQRLAALGLVLVLGFLLGLGSLAVFATLAGEVAEQETARLDTAVLLWLHQFASPGLDLAAQAISLLGSELLDAFVVLLLISFIWRRQWGAAVGLVLVVGGAFLLDSALKAWFQRPRPSELPSFFPGQSNSFPSGHAMVSAAFYSYLAYLTWRTVRGGRRVLWVGLLATLVLLIGLSRLYLGVHYLTDVVAGYLAGLIWTDCVILAGAALRQRPQASTARPRMPAERIT